MGERSTHPTVTLLRGSGKFDGIEFQASIQEPTEVPL